MIADSFVDTNILIYAAAGRHEFPAKYARAWDIIGPGRYGISGQILAEFFVNALKKPKVPLTLEEAVGWVQRLAILPVVPIDRDIVQEAISTKARYGISYWDAAIIVAANRLEAKTLYTEDLNHGQLYGAVRALNPFIQ
jgi:predicted nucleic acid-binding protein